MPETRPSEIVAQIDAEMLARATGGVSSYSIAGRSFTKTPIGELMTMRNYYANLAALQSGHGTTVADLSRESVEADPWA